MALFAHASKRADDASPALDAARWLSLAAATPTAEPAKPTLAADCLSLAAAPTFAVMALLTAASPDMICMTTSDAFPITGMTSMYLLMTGFHLAPWLRFVGGWGMKR